MNSKSLGQIMYMHNVVAAFVVNLCQYVFPQYVFIIVNSNGHGQFVHLLFILLLYFLSNVFNMASTDSRRAVVSFWGKNVHNTD